MQFDEQTNELVQPVAAYWHSLTEDRVGCDLCPHGCVINPGQRGICKARQNRRGQLVADSYGKITSLALDPVEKKPLAHFFPGSMILSAGSFGCNFACAFCQNWTIAQQLAPWQMISPGQMADLARDYRKSGNIGLAYTYNEPLVSYEYVRDCARLMHEAGMKNVLVTNGSINPEPLEALLPLIDAMNIDLKAWQEPFYRKICHGRLEPVLETIRRSVGRCHVEITTLLIPGLNDSREDMDAMASWLAELDKDLVLHLSRHHPAYHMTEPGPVSRSVMENLAACAHRHLKYVMLGNI